MNKQGKKPIPSKPAPKVTIAKGPFHFEGRKFHYAFCITVVVFCFFLYGNSISNGFSLDDEFVTHGDTVVHKGISSIPKLFKMRYAWDQKGSYGYRPIVKASFSLEQQFFGDSPHTGHFINILMYAFLCIFLFYLVRKLFYDYVSDYFLFAVFAVFIAHPMHTEVVDSLKNRDVLLSCIFGFYSCFGFLKGFETEDIVKKVVWILSGMVAFCLSELSKPDAVIFLAIIPLVIFFFDKNTYKTGLLTVLLLFVTSFGLKFFVHSVLPHQSYHRTLIFIEDPLLHTHWFQRIALGFYSLWFYVHKLIFPKDMVCYYGYDDINPTPRWTDINVVMGMFIAMGWAYLVYRNRKGNKVLLFSLLFFGGTTAAYINVIGVGPGLVADRFTFVPSLGYSICLVFLIYYLLKLPLLTKLGGIQSRNLYTVAGIIVLLFFIRTIVRNPDWKSHLSIYEHDVKLAPRSAKLQSLLASCYNQQIQQDPGMSDEDKAKYYTGAEQAYMASLAVYPEYVTSLNNLGMIQYSYYHNLPKALGYFRDAVKYDTTYVEALFNTGDCYMELDKLDSAEQYLMQTIKINPEYYMAYIYLAKVDFKEGRLDKVLKFSQDALDHGHNSDFLYVNIGNVYLAQKDTNKAAENYAKALDINANNLPLAGFLAKYNYEHGDIDKAKFYAKMAKRAKEQSDKVTRLQ